jgi:hypothetical protein
VAPAIVAALAIAGAHPFCNLIWHCGCGALTLTAHCNIHTPVPLTGPTAPLSFGRGPAHCPWCTQPAWFALAAVLALVGASLAMRLARRRTMAILPSVGAGLVGVIAGASLGALVTFAAR